MENDQQWFSAMVRLVALVDFSGAKQYMDCLHVFRSADWDSALQQALTLGRTHEHEYTNAEGQTLSWKLKEVLTLDAITSDELDGAEVYSEFKDVGLEDDQTLKPEASAPTQTI